MRTNYITDVTKVFILVATVISVCILCAVGFKLVNDGKSSINANTNQINELSAQYQDIDLSLYNGSLIPGSEVIHLIKKAIEEKQYLAIEVKTLNGDYATYNYAFIADGDKKTLKDIGQQGQTPMYEIPTQKQDYGYINPMAMFLGKTFMDDKGIIVCIHFEQQP